MPKRILAFIGIVIFLFAAGAPVSAGLQPAEGGTAGPDQVVSMRALTPNDSYFKILQVKSFTNMSITESWDITGGSSKIVVAVLDTGVDAGHPDLEGRVLPDGYNFVANNTDFSDDNGHGTMCAGIIAAGVNNEKGLAGATQGCMILPVKVLDTKGNAQVSTIASGIIYAADHGANIINLSLGCPGASADLQKAVDYAYGKGILVVAASGNSGTEIEYPAAYEHVVAVGSVTSSNEVASYSNHGSRLALVAVGSGIFSTSLKNGYSVGNGTSFAAPFVSSLAALLLSVNEKLTPDELTGLMENTATDLGETGWDQYYGFGCINYSAALKAAAPVDQAATPPAGTEAAPSIAATAAQTDEKETASATGAETAPSDTAKSVAPTVAETAPAATN